MPIGASTALVTGVATMGAKSRNGWGNSKPLRQQTGVATDRASRRLARAGTKFVPAAAILAKHRAKMPESNSTLSSAYARHIGRVGALAVALGIGGALVPTSPVALADDSPSSTSSNSDSSSSAAGTESPPSDDTAVSSANPSASVRRTRHENRTLPRRRHPLSRPTTPQARPRRRRRCPNSTTECPCGPPAVRCPPT